MTELERIAAFWKWFEQNNRNYLFINQVEDLEVRDGLLDDFIIQLHQYCEHLYFEMGGHEDAEEIELVITAEGDRQYFPKVELLVDHAPKIKGWTFVKFKQAQGSDFKTSYRGREYDPSETIFIPLHSKEEPQGVGIRICYPDYSELERDDFYNGTYLMLDVLLGEKSTTLDIDYLEIIATPEDIGRYEFLHIDQLPAFILEKKGKLRTH